MLDLLVQLARLLAPHLAAPPDGGGIPTTRLRCPESSGARRRWRRCAREVVRAAAGTGVVHIFGETGTGKERIAHAVHLRSGARRTVPGCR